MRVMLLNGRLSDRGGADRWLLGVLARLQGRVETLLAVGYQDRQLPREEKERLGRWIRLKGLDSRGLGQRGLQGSLSRLQQVLDDFEPHVVHVNDVTDPDLLRLVAASGRGVMTVQDHRFFCPGQGKVDSDGEPCLEPMDDDRCLGCLHDPRYGHKMLELTRQRLDALAGMRRITVLSRYMASELAAAAPDLAPIEVLPPFVDGLEEPDECRVVSKRHHLLAGRLSVHKGLEVALRNALAVARAGRLGLKESDYLVATDLAATDEDFSTLLSAWTAAPTPLAGLRVLIEARWAWLAEHDAWFTFSDDELAAYAAKLMLLHQWRRLAEAGEDRPVAEEANESPGSLERTTQ